MQYPITNIYTSKDGVKYKFEYFDADSFDDLPKEQVRQVYVIAFQGDKFIVVNNVTKPGSYTPIGGGVDEGEYFGDTLHREVKEESNMKILEFKPIGYQIITKPDSDDHEVRYELRYAAKVEPYGPFLGDPAGDVTELIYCDRNDYKKYFDWEEKGDVIVEKAYKIMNLV